MRAFLWGSVVLLVGCSAADPCDGLSGTCLSARVEGQPSMLEQLRITVDGQPAPMTTAGGSFTLPVRLAIVFNSPPGATAQITIDGLVGGNLAGSSGKRAVPLTANGKSSFTFQLAAVDGDGGLGDGFGDGGPGDGSPMDGPPPNVVSFTPSTFTYPDTARGTKQSVVATILATNNTTKTVTATGMTSTGSANAFNFEPGTTCPMSGTTMFAPGGSCTMVISFKPNLAGALQQDIGVTFDDGETVMLTLKGRGLAAWDNETPAGATTNFEAVWASGPSDWWAVGHDATCAIWHSRGDGQWTATCGTVTTHNFFSVGGSDPNDVWFGGDAGNLWHFSNGNFTQDTPAPNTRFIRGIIGFTATDAMAIDSQGAAYCLAGASAFSVCNPPTPNAFNATSLTGTSVSVFAGGLSHQLWFHQPMTAVWGSYSFPSAISNMDVNGVWMAPNATNDIYAVGGVGVNTLAIFHASMSTGPVSETGQGAQGPLYAVAGRKDPNGGLDVYAVGAIGQQVLHTTGGGTWTQPQVPVAGMSLSNRGVWVASDGQVMVVGDSAQILHFW